MRNSSKLLAICAGIGVIATGIASYRAGCKAVKAKEELQNASRTQKIALLAHFYIPPITLGVYTICCVYGLYTSSQRQINGIMAGYSALNKYYNDYRNAVIDRHGAEEDEEIRRGILVAERCDQHYWDDGINNPDKKRIFWDRISNNEIEMYERDAIHAEYHFNRNFVGSGCASLNDFYNMVGLPLTDDACDLGWTCYDGIFWVDIEHIPTIHPDGREVVEFCFITPPEKIDEDIF